MYRPCLQWLYNLVADIDKPKGTIGATQVLGVCYVNVKWNVITSHIALLSCFCFSD